MYSILFIRDKIKVITLIIIYSPNFVETIIKEKIIFFIIVFLNYDIFPNFFNFYLTIYIYIYNRLENFGLKKGG